MSDYFDGSKFMSAVRVGAKGQIVIPKEVRDMFEIKPGDSLLFMADKEQGMAMDRIEVFDRIAEAIFSGHAKSIYPGQSEENSRQFARIIKNVEEGDENGSNQNS